MGKIVKMSFEGKFLQEMGKWTEYYINDAGHMTKMATMPIYGKTLQKFSRETVDGFQLNLACSIGY